MPQGGIDPLENPMVAALRELREETGMRSVVLLGTLDGWLDYDFPTEVRSQMSSTWLRFRGQTQKWYVVLILHMCSQHVCSQHMQSTPVHTHAWSITQQIPT